LTGLAEFERELIRAGRARAAALGRRAQLRGEAVAAAAGAVASSTLPRPPRLIVRNLLPISSGYRRLSCPTCVQISGPRNGPRCERLRYRRAWYEGSPQGWSRIVAWPLSLSLRI
jgi:hypothetical protein